MSSQEYLGEQAIVVGASIAGLLSAQVLSTHYKHVLVLERDDHDSLFGEPTAPRKGTPQSRHIHILLNGGEGAISKLLPGFDDELVAAGATVGDFARDIRWRLNEGWMPRFKSGLRMYLQSRPLIEHLIRRRIKAQSNITIQPNWRVKDYLLADDGLTVDGLAAIDKTGQVHEFKSDLIVDAGGRGALFPHWLKARGFGQVPTEEIKFDLAYSTTTFEMPKDSTRDWSLMACYPNPPYEFRGGVISEIENGQWQTTLYGYHGDYPPTDVEGFKCFAHSLAEPDIYEALKDLDPSSDIIRHRFPMSILRRYDRMSRLPRNIVAIGDAVCSLNPAFAQGMSGVALEAYALKKLLTQHVEKPFSPAQFTSRYFRTIHKVLQLPWDLARDECFKYPQTEGKKPWLHELSSWYKDRIVRSGEEKVIDQFYRVMHLIDPPSRFFKPAMAAKILNAPKTKSVSTRLN